MTSRRWTSVARAGIVVIAALTARPAEVMAQDPAEDLQDPRAAEADSLRQRLERIESIPDSLLTDSLRFVRDSLVAHRDSVAQAGLARRRDELSGGDFPERDALFEALAKQAGYQVVEYRGEVVGLEVERRRLDLQGQAQLNRSSEVLVADTIRYLGDRQFIEARRAIELLGADGQKATSDSLLYYDIDRLRGTLFDAESSFNDGGTEWRVFGNVIPLAQDTIYATHSAFTSCDLEEPHYSFRAGQLKMVTRNVLVAWPVTLYVSRVPVFWLPFFAADIRQGRRSGILPPRFGFNDIVQTSGQTGRNISDFGYYWAINDYLDAQATVDWFSGNYTRLNGAFRYRFLKQFIRGSLIYSQSFGDDGENLRVQAGHEQELGLNTTFRAALNYVSDTRIFQDQSVNPNEQTQTIDSDIGFNHRFGFGNLQLSADRQQYLDGSRTTTNLPRANLSILPVTLFGAPRNRAGPFNNITLDGSTRFARMLVRADSAADRTTTTGGAAANVRVGRLTVANTLNVSDLETVAQDSVFEDLPPETQTALDWRTSASYQINLMGSTTLSPTAELRGGRFRSDSTGGEFVGVPGRASLGARLTTDIYGFYGGVGPFTRLRHKLSPALVYSYSPAVDVDSMLAAIPGFPVNAGDARNTLSFGLNQTLEAKLPARQVARRDSVIADTLVGGPLPVADSVPTSRDAVGPDGLPAPTRRERDRIVTLLGLRTQALVFDFERRKFDEPVLVSASVSNTLTSDLLRGVTVNMTHDLFEGTGTGQSFDLFLTNLNASFGISSGQGLGDIFGLGSGGGPGPRQAATTAVDRFRDPTIYGGVDPFSDGAGPWSASLTYSLQRSRPEEGGRKTEALGGSFSLRPTSHWSIRWTTQYSLSEREFGQNIITFDRDLHRWLASFQFARAPNGNTVFQVSLSLKDAPDIRTQYNQRTE